MAVDNDNKELFAFTCMSDFANVAMLNGLKTTMMTFKNAIHAPQMAFTLISISRLDKASYQVTFRRECAPYST